MLGVSFNELFVFLGLLIVLAEGPKLLKFEVSHRNSISNAQVPHRPESVRGALPIGNHGGVKLNEAEVVLRV